MCSSDLCCEAAAQHQRRVIKRNGLFAAQAKLGAGGGDLLAIVGEREGVGAGRHLLGVGRQMVAGELAGGIGRESARWRCDPVAALEPSGNRIGVEAGAETVDAGDGLVGKVSTVSSDAAQEIGRASCRERV